MFSEQTVAGKQKTKVLDELWSPHHVSSLPCVCSLVSFKNKHNLFKNKLNISASW